MEENKTKKMFKLLKERLREKWGMLGYKEETAIKYLRKFIIGRFINLWIR